MEKAFVDMLNRHRGIIYKVCNLYCNEPDDKQDLFQEITLQLWKAFPAFRQQAQQSTWMYRVALNTAISNFRKENRRPRLNPLSELDFSIPDDYPPNQKNEQLNELMQAIAKLNAVEKAIIMLYLEEKSYDEIADITGITKNNVGVKLNRIKLKLETLLKP
ncbi:RNA polymerase sigma factor [Mucilaginibacter terrae]|uniref:RNA polymerase sigma factor (Sigma-70 family) n=1 Tax=Mucilaginibacter terrae TaxID=1955052 RepID=A0ABU3GZX9_9SPHI|nr:RNA polymerase sigma factor [Mucilaginibacter terrae]MDT3405176.1 RNA polymerase sigma factor (sigma-70 family) [Mucilaginibacter terrae]